MQRVHLHNSNSLLQEEREKGREGERERERKVWDNGGLRSAARYPTRDDLCSLLLHLLPFLPSMPILSNTRIPSYENRESKDYYV